MRETTAKILFQFGAFLIASIILRAEAVAETHDQSGQIKEYYRSCLNAMTLDAHEAELMCACAAGVYTAAFNRHLNEIAASAIAQNCFPAFRD